MVLRTLVRALIVVLMVALALPSSLVRAADPGDQLPKPDEGLLQAEPVRAAKELHEGLSEGQRRSLSAALDRYKPRLDAARKSVADARSGDAGLPGRDTKVGPAGEDRKATQARLKADKSVAQELDRITAHLDAEIVGLLTPAQRVLFKKGKERPSRAGIPRAEAPTMEGSPLPSGAELAVADLTPMALDSAGDVYLAAEQDLSLSRLVTLTASPTVADAASCNTAAYYTRYAQYYAENARVYAYYDYLVYGQVTQLLLNSYAYYAYVYLHSADYNIDAAAHYLNSGYPRNAQAYMGAGYSDAYNGSYYAYHSYQTTSSSFANAAYYQGYYAWVYASYAYYYLQSC